MLALQDMKEGEQNNIKQLLMSRLDRYEVIDSVKAITASINQEANAQFSETKVKHVMKCQLGMSFKKIKDVSLQENSARSLILRQQFAIRYIEAAMKKKRIINIDQTWLGMEDFRRYKWKHPDYSNSIPKKNISPRISLILALDNFGRSYIALTQVNTDSEVMILFLRDLVKLLNEEDRSWRQKTFFTLDGAKYHRSSETLAVCEEL